MGLNKSASRGMFVHSCYLHMHFASSSETWMSITLANKVRFSSAFSLIFDDNILISLILVYICNLQTIEQAVTDWYFDRGSFQEIDFKHVLPLNCTDSFHDKKSSSVPRNGLMSFLFSSFSFI